MSLEHVHAHGVILFGRYKKGCCFLSLSQLPGDICSTECSVKNVIATIKRGCQRGTAVCTSVGHSTRDIKDAESPGDEEHSEEVLLRLKLSSGPLTIEL